MGNVRPTVTMTVDGQAVEGEPPGLPVEDPALARPFAHAPRCTPYLLGRAVNACGTAFPSWAARPESDRREHLLACGDALSPHTEELALLLTREQGKPLRDARAEVRRAVDWFRHTAELALPVETFTDDQGTEVTLTRKPHGVVAAISPSNFPVILSVCKIAPALLAGNTVVLKPSPETPLTALRIGELLREVLPAGVLNVVSGDASLGAALTARPGVGMISFTGSPATGRAIARQAAETFTPVVLELGGNDPAIVLPGTDIDAVAGPLFRAALVNNGQFCAAVKRVYVPRALRDQLLDALGELASSAVVGPGLDAGTELGPLVSRAQRDTVAAMVEEAVAAGARVTARGKCPEGEGHFYPPTVITDLPEGGRLEVEEQFGPVIPVIAYDEVPQAVERANATPYGLGASVWGAGEELTTTADALRCGTVWLNTHGELRHDAPFGGVGCSGTGVEYGYWGLLEYTRIAVRNVSPPTA
ncbi:aldehyde dehydrogenase family protein [Streptomyces netropsis]|uniref:Acyl-CoA reductase-like NAD-dependent aldehyde dehydrogenase n=1 Tax=Streptomyces netropsis TaxID=55404 RepID=A0A7W7L827_STRNE|nr:aldehyde dehydrogenase family protein [Streptomyces netropsis]MBB4885179.1 acyl-CoA reductase-like NAD-dependent aldehyde dehydrogenase [Streptomyces netropsis]